MEGAKTNESVLLKFLSRSSMPLPIVNYAYDVNGNMAYIGIAIQGSADSDPAWRVERLSYEVDPAGGYRVTSHRFSKANAVWNDYAGLAYS